MSALPTGRILVGEVLDRLAELPTASIDCVITSPPYFQLRDYGVDGQIGLETDIEQWVDDLLLVMRGVARVLKPTGTVWLNLGDSYSRATRYGAPAKSLLLGPERLVIALSVDGWIARNQVVWAKTNTMPTSVRDRLACTHEVIYLLTRAQAYAFDLDAIREPHRSAVRLSTDSGARRQPRTPRGRPSWAGPLAGSNSGLARLKARGQVGHPLGKNPGDVWTIAASNFRGAHFATFPQSLIVRPLLASCPERVCTTCGRPWRRRLTRHRQGGLVADCQCQGSHQPGVVLDPFMGAGTVAVVAEQHHRQWVGIELNPEFARLATERIEAARRNREDKEPGRAA